MSPTLAAARLDPPASGRGDGRAHRALQAASAAAVVGLLLLWAADDGGYGPLAWYPGALLACALVAASSFGAHPRLARPARVAVVALALYVGWSYASIAWSAAPGDALTGSHRALLYLLLFALCARLEWTARGVELALAAYALGVGALATAIVGRLALHPAPELLIDGQLAAPVGYHNGTAGLGTIGAVVAIALGCRRTLPAAARAALAAAATACLELSLLAESRGWLYTLPLVAAIAFALAPARARMAAWSLVALLPALATLPWLLHGWEAAARGRGAAGERAVAVANVASARTALAAVLLSAVLAALLGRADARFALGTGARRVARAGVRWAALGLALGIVVLGATRLADGAGARAWRQFAGDAPARPGELHFAALGSGRYDFWRVSLQAVRQHPLGGLGQDNFARTYVAVRRTDEEPSWTHSLPLRLLAHTGLVGLALFGAALAAAVLAVRRVAPGARAVAGVALLPATVWLVHGSVDWFWELPALSGPAFCFLGAATALAASGQTGRRVGRRWSPALCAAAGAAALALTPAYLGERAQARGRALAAARPGAALRALARAARLQPLSSAPGVLAGAVQLGRERPAAALAALDEALARDRASWLIWLELGLAHGRAGHHAAARAALARAATLNPREPVIALARRRAGTTTPLTIADAAALFTQRVQRRLGR